MPPRTPAAPVTLDAVELRILHMPLVSPFTAYSEETTKELATMTAAAQAVRARPYAADPVATLAVAAAVHAAALTRLMSLVEHHGELRSQGEVDRLLDDLKLVERHRAFSRQVASTS